MYSIPQHAVTNGYWKIENFRAQPRAASRRLVKNVPLNMLLPFQCAAVPSIDVADHENSQKDADLNQSQHFHVPLAEDDGPGIEEHQFHVKQNEQDRGQI